MIHMILGQDELDTYVGNLSEDINESDIYVGNLPEDINESDTYVGNLPEDINESDLFELFGLYTTNYLRDNSDVQIPLSENTGKKKRLYLCKSA